MYKTVGISPKVLIPFAIQIIGAAVLYLMGERDIATGLVSAAVVTAIAGYAAAPGDVRPVELGE